MADNSLRDLSSESQTQQAIKELALSLESLDTHRGCGDSFVNVYQALERLMEATGHTYAANIARNRSHTRSLKEKKRSCARCV